MTGILQTRSRFLSTPSGWRATSKRLTMKNLYIFLSTPSGWRATRTPKRCRASVPKFLSTPSGWRATYCIQRILRNNQFLSTPSGWRATGKGRVNTNAGEVFLSTPSGWRATFVKFMITVLHSDFYPRPPGGGRPMLGSACRLKMHFYPRPPGGGRLGFHFSFRPFFCISIHALRVEGDLMRWSPHIKQRISIHALRVEGDRRASTEVSS